MGHQVKLGYENLSLLIAKKQRTMLTPRQIQIARALSLGKNRKQIAEELGICEKTVDFHVTGNSETKTIKGKLGFNDVARLTHWSILNRIVKLGEPLANPERKRRT